MIPDYVTQRDGNPTWPAMAAINKSHTHVFNERSFDKFNYARYILSSQKVEAAAATYLYYIPCKNSRE